MTERQRHYWEEIFPLNKTYKCRLCGAEVEGNMGDNPNDYHKDCNNYSHFCDPLKGAKQK